jgi:hypothetical protein
MFGRIMVAVDEDIISLDIPRWGVEFIGRDGRECPEGGGGAGVPTHTHPRDTRTHAHTLPPHRSADETKLSMHVKDAMREACIGQVRV